MVNVVLQQAVLWGSERVYILHRALPHILFPHPTKLHVEPLTLDIICTVVCNYRTVLGELSQYILPFQNV